MRVIRGPDQARHIEAPAIRRLVEERFDQILNGDEYDPEIHGEMIVVEPGDTLNSLEEETGLPIATSLFDDCRFPHPDFAPAAEFIEEHAPCFEALYLFSDDGAGINFFVPKSPGIDADLLALCARFAVRETTSL
jgi:hypothetical protein